MSALLAMTDDLGFWAWYFATSAAISLTAGIVWWWRLRPPEVQWPERLHGVLWNASVQFFGFILLFLQMILLVGISRSERPSAQVIFGVIYFPVFFYTLFCISGRGVEVLQRMSDRGIKEIRITWSGMHVTLGGKDDNRDRARSS